MKKALVSISEKEVILLGLIAEEPIHAYGLEEKIQVRQMNLWTTIGFSSIYRVLVQLEEKGLIESRLDHSGQGATRKVHAINDAGRQALALGVLEYLGSTKPIRSIFSVGLANITQAPLARILTTLAARSSRCEALQREIESILARHLSAEPETRARISIQMIFSHAAHHLRAEKDFILEAIELLGREKNDSFAAVSLVEGATDIHIRDQEE